MAALLERFVASMIVVLSAAPAASGGLPPPQLSSSNVTVCLTSGTGASTTGQPAAAHLGARTRLPHSTFTAPAAESAQRQPSSVLFILADDLGWSDLSNEGSRCYESPHIDSIAAQGMKFVRGYAASRVCSPSRASIMTGKYTPNHGITSWIGDPAGSDWRRNNRHDSHLPAEYERGLRAEELTLAEVLLAANYRTFYAGKYHVSTAFRPYALRLRAPGCSCLARGAFSPTCFTYSLYIYILWPAGAPQCFHRSGDCAHCSLLIASICSAAPAQLGPDAPRGFEINKGGHHAGSPPGGYFSPYKNPALADGPPGESLPIRLGEETADFILAHADAPFFAFLAFYSVHGPIQTTQALWQKYRDKAVCLSHSLSLSLSLSQIS